MKLDPLKRIFGSGVKGSMVVPTAMLYMSGKEAFCLWSNFFISLSFQIPLLSIADIIRIVNYIFFFFFLYDTQAYLSIAGRLWAYLDILWPLMQVWEEVRKKYDGKKLKRKIYSKKAEHIFFYIFFFNIYIFKFKLSCLKIIKIKYVHQVFQLCSVIIRLIVIIPNLFTRV